MTLDMTAERWLVLALVVLGFLFVQLLVFHRSYVRALRDQSVRVAGQRVAEYIATEHARGLTRLFSALYLFVALLLLTYLLRAGLL